MSSLIAICDTYILLGSSYWLSNVCSICGNAGFSTVLKGCISLAMIVDCREDGDGPSVALRGYTHNDNQAHFAPILPLPDHGILSSVL